MSKEVNVSNNVLQAIIIIVLVVVVGIVLYVKQGQKADEAVSLQKTEGVNVAHRGDGANPLSSARETGGRFEKPIPLLLDLGATKCIPCKMMAPILDELREEYRGRFDVVFIDVWENKEAIGRYNIHVIPTQIFFDAEGKERYRHQGFYSKEEILRKWKELGINLDTEKG